MFSRSKVAVSDGNAPVPSASDKNSSKASKNNKKCIRFLTAIGYVLSVSMAALVMGMYYLISWTPYEDSNLTTQSPQATESNTETGN